MALGGVATGIIKAHEADSVAGTINNNGCTCMLCARAARIGIIMVVEAILEVNSVTKVISAQIVRIINQVGASHDAEMPS